MAYALPTTPGGRTPLFFFAGPEVGWFALSPMLTLLAGALGIMLLGALTPKWPNGWYAMFSAITAGTAAAFAMVQWDDITDNGASVAVVNQFDTTGSFTGPPEVAISVRRVSFHRPVNGTTAYSHTAKVFPGGRDITEDEAVATAKATLQTMGLDPTNLIMKVTTDADSASRLQRLDVESNQLVDQLMDAPID